MERHVSGELLGVEEFKLGQDGEVKSYDASDPPYTDPRLINKAKAIPHSRGYPHSTQADKQPTSSTPPTSSGLSSSLSSLSRAELLSVWQEVMGRPAPKRLSVKFMILAIEHEYRCKADGWLSARELRVLRAYLNTGDTRVFRQEQFTCGDRLVREWNGKVYEVEVLESGYLFKGKEYRSLSGIAKLITGTNWSGPRFFGLRSAS